MGTGGPGGQGPLPFPWQQRLVRYVAHEQRWPDLLELPTASGKTAVLVAAVFLLALDPERSPRRTVMVVDRRLIVDQAYVLATRLAKLLAEGGSDPVTRAVAARLSGLTEARECRWWRRGCEAAGCEATPGR